MLPALPWQPSHFSAHLVPFPASSLLLCLAGTQTGHGSAGTVSQKGSCALAAAQVSAASTDSCLALFFMAEEDQRRVGRAATERERSSPAEAAGEERARGECWQWQDTLLAQPPQPSCSSLCLFTEVSALLSKHSSVLVTASLPLRQLLALLLTVQEELWSPSTWKGS